MLNIESGECPTGKHGFWFKKITNLHRRISEDPQECLNRGVVPDWLTIGRTLLIMKERREGKGGKGREGLQIIIDL